MSRSEDFGVLGIYTKSYNKWHMCELGKQKWSMYCFFWGGEYRVYARMVRFDHGIGRYEHADPIKSEWETDDIYVSIDAAQIDKALGSWFIQLWGKCMVSLSTK